MKRSYRLRKTREWRPEITVEPTTLEYIANRCAVCSDSELEMAAARRYEAEQAVLMRWVRREMGRRLTKQERRLVELYYIEAMTLKNVAHRRKVHVSTVSRSVRRAVGKLRDAARELAGTEEPRRAALQAMARETK
ncbi:MAG: hypothetical protein KAH38_10040, partial [Candidatus Hydrogenedentes bacterium]|nr:hypothetical protein [Candidatus Hydrogenedentota bacterium]